MRLTERLQRLRRFRLNIGLQVLGVFLTFLRAVLVYVLLAQLLWNIQPLHWSVWLTYWASMLLAVACWALYGLLDVDGDGQEPVA